VSPTYCSRCTQQYREKIPVSITHSNHLRRKPSYQKANAVYHRALLILVERRRTWPRLQTHITIFRHSEPKVMEEVVRQSIRYIRAIQLRRSSMSATDQAAKCDVLPKNMIDSQPRSRISVFILTFDSSSGVQVARESYSSLPSNCACSSVVSGCCSTRVEALES